MIDFENYYYITLVEYIGFMSKTILPIFLNFRVNILYKRYQYNDLDRDIVISITETSYVNNDIALK